MPSPINWDKAKSSFKLKRKNAKFAARKSRESNISIKGLLALNKLESEAILLLCQIEEKGLSIDGVSLTSIGTMTKSKLLKIIDKMQKLLNK